MKFKYYLVIILTSLLSNGHFATAQEANHGTTDSENHKIRSIKDFIQHSEWRLHSRTFFMATVNAGNLKDDFTLAKGVGIGLLTPPIKGFQLGLSGYFIFNVVSSKLEEKDPTTGLANRYELGQYDLVNQLNKKDLNRLENLFIRYTDKKNNSITVGRMELQTPFMNMQDGRMRPTIEEGVWLTLKQSKKIGFNGGFIWAVSPRSTVEVFRASESVGIYGQGVNTDGTKSNYKHNIVSNGFAMGNIYIKPTNGLEISIWDGYFDNVMNTVFLEIKNEHKSRSTAFKFYEGLMLIRQDAVNNGGNNDQSKTYINKGAKSNTISARLGIKSKKIDWNINYTHITDDGRYLMPREWGRDPLYTFLARERNEGLGNTNAFSTNFTLNFLKERMKTGIAYGYYDLPDIANFEMNKYGMPSYHQINLVSSYNFENLWKGLEIRLLIAGKINATKESLDPIYVYNKVNLINFNLILDLRI